MTGLRRPTLFVALWQHGSNAAASQAPEEEEKEAPNMTVQSLELPKDKMPSSPVIFGQAAFARDDTLIATGYQYTEDGRRLGTIWCANRPAAIWELHFDPSSVKNSKDTGAQASDDKKSSGLIVTSAAIISDPTLSSLHPRVYSDPNSGQNTVFWLSHKPGGAHIACFSLRSFNLETRKTMELIPVVSKPDASFMERFVGLQAGIPSEPFVTFNGRAYMLAHSIAGTKQEILLIDIVDPYKVFYPTRQSAVAGGEESEHWCWNALATDGHHNILCWRSSSTNLPQLVVGTLNGTSLSPSVDWQVIDKVDVPHECWPMFLNPECAPALLMLHGILSAHGSRVVEGLGCLHTQWSVRPDNRDRAFGARRVKAQL